MSVSQERMVGYIGIYDLTWRLWLYSYGEFLFWGSNFDCLLMWCYYLVLNLNCRRFPSTISFKILIRKLSVVKHAGIFHWKRLVEIWCWEDIINKINILIETKWGNCTWSYLFLFCRSSLWFGGMILQVIFDLFNFHSRFSWYASKLMI